MTYNTKVIFIDFWFILPVNLQTIVWLSHSRNAQHLYKHPLCMYSGQQSLTSVDSSIQFSFVIFSHNLKLNCSGNAMNCLFAFRNSISRPFSQPHDSLENEWLFSRSTFGSAQAICEMHANAQSLFTEGTLQWRIQDFPDGECADPWVWDENLLFCNIFTQTAWKWKKLAWEVGASLVSSLGSANALNNLKYSKVKKWITRQHFSTMHTTRLETGHASVSVSTA